MMIKKSILSIMAAFASACCLAAEPELGLDACIESASVYHSVNTKTLKAIVFQESSGQAWKTNRNTNNSIDYGAAGINSIHLPELAKFGITSQSLMDGCTNVYVGAWKYAQKVAKYGNTWFAVGAYHSESPAKRDRYIKLIQSHLIRWGTLRPLTPGLFASR